MRILIPFALIAALSACSKEPDFNERYEKAEAEIEARVRELDAAVIEAETASDQDHQDHQDHQDQAVGVKPAGANAERGKLTLPVELSPSTDTRSSGE